MKNTASNPNATTQAQTKDSRQNQTPGGAGARNNPTNSASASQQASEKAKRGEPLSANKTSERSPKQENL